MSKSDGSNFERIEKGNFYIRNVGRCKILLNPQNQYFIEIKADGKLYYLSAATDEETNDIYVNLLHN